MKTSKFFDSRFFPLVFLLVSFVFLLIYSLSTSPLYAYQGFDSAVFRTIGLGITQGKLPYVDLFDHKGPFIFYIDALGIWLIHDKTGIFLLQTLFLAATLYIIYRLDCLLTDRKTAMAVTLLMLIPLVDFISDGNQCEEWMLPFVSLSLYLSVSWLTGKSGKYHPVWYSFVYGVCFAFLFFTRPNDAVASIGAVMFGVFLAMLVKKMYLSATYNVMGFIAGCASAALPVCLYFASEGILADMFYGTVLFNLGYASDLTSFGWGILAVVIIVIGASIFIVRKDRNLYRLNFIFIPYLIFTLILIGKRDYWHYLLPIIPYISLLFIFSLRRGLKPLVICLSVLFLAGSFQQHILLSKNVMHRCELKEFYSSTDKLFEQLPEDERNDVWNYNLFPRIPGDRRPPIYSLRGVFVNAGVTPSNRVFSPPHLASFDDSERIENNSPKWVMRYFDGEETESTGFIDSNYELVAESDCKCRIGLYRRIDENIETDCR